MKRRRFVKTASSAALGIIAARAPLFAKSASSEKVVVCVMGLNGRGTVLAKTFAKTPNAEVASVCDVDSTVLAKAAATLGVKGISDFRRALQRVPLRRRVRDQILFRYLCRGRRPVDANSDPDAGLQLPHAAELRSQSVVRRARHDAQVARLRRTGKPRRGDRLTARLHRRASGDVDVERGVRVR